MREACLTLPTINQPIIDPETLLIRKDGIKNKAPKELPISNFEKGTANNDAMIPVPITSPIAAQL